MIRIFWHPHLLHIPPKAFGRKATFPKTVVVLQKESILIHLVVISKCKGSSTIFLHELLVLQ